MGESELHGARVIQPGLLRWIELDVEPPEVGVGPCGAGQPDAVAVRMPIPLRTRAGVARRARFLLRYGCRAVAQLKSAARRESREQRRGDGKCHDTDGVPSMPDSHQSTSVRLVEGPPMGSQKGKIHGANEIGAQHQGNPQTGRRRGNQTTISTGTPTLRERDPCWSQGYGRNRDEVPHRAALSEQPRRAHGSGVGKQLRHTDHAFVEVAEQPGRLPEASGSRPRRSGLQSTSSSHPLIMPRDGGQARSSAVFGLVCGS